MFWLNKSLICLKTAYIVEHIPKQGNS